MGQSTASFATPQRAFCRTLDCWTRFAGCFCWLTGSAEPSSRHLGKQLPWPTPPPAESFCTSAFNQRKPAIDRIDPTTELDKSAVQGHKTAQRTRRREPDRPNLNPSTHPQNRHTPATAVQRANQQQLLLVGPAGHKGGEATHTHTAAANPKADQ